LFAFVLTCAILLTMGSERKIDMPRCALITGGTRGIGLAAAMKLADSCAKICLTYRNDAEQAEQALEAFDPQTCEVITLRCDVTNPEEVKTLFGELKQAQAIPGIVVNNAGVLSTNYVRFMSDEEWHQPISTSLDGAFYVTRRALKGMMRKRWGRIINVASDAGLMGDAMRAAYAAAKAGMLGFTRSTAREVAAMGITVNAIAPGLIETRMTQEMPDARREAMLAQVPMGRMGLPKEIANLIGFLASDESSYMTGQTICIDGGMNMRQ
jgi:3-oxoacyl-[acyl-carrier protein] reductase